MEQYTLEWLQYSATPTLDGKNDFHWKQTGELNGDYEITCWKEFETFSEKRAKELIDKYIHDSIENIEIFCVKNKGREIWNEETFFLTRKEKVAMLISDDINDIIQSYYEDDTSFIERVLMGDKWRPYNQLSDIEIEREYQSRKFNN